MGGGGQRRLLSLVGTESTCCEYRSMSSMTCSYSSSHCSSSSSNTGSLFLFLHLGSLLEMSSMVTQGELSPFFLNRSVSVAEEPDTEPNLRRLDGSPEMRGGTNSARKRKQ